MPNPTCVECNTTEALLWRNVENGQICNDCHISSTTPKDAKLSTAKTENDDKKEEKEDDIKSEIDPTAAKVTGRQTRKSTRSTRYKPKTPVAPPKTPVLRGRGRRSIFKRQPLKAPTSTATVVTSNSVFFKGTYMQIGDIVSMIDESSNKYYAQIRGFLTDQYCEKSAAVTWLLPTNASPPPHEGFDPSTYIIGPEEDMPRKLEYMEFVMHAPSDYYKASNSPYPLIAPELEEYAGFIWTTLDQREKC